MQRVDKETKKFHGTMPPDKTHKVHKKTKKKPTPRPRPLPPHVTARNLANEKKKRGEMNEKFLEMARLVPDLAAATKLNRVLIVNETVSHLRHQRSICIAAAHDVRRIVNENHSLRTELDALRQMTGQFVCSNVQQTQTAFSDSLREFLSIETQPLGAFPDGLGGHYGDAAEKDESGSPVSATEQAATDAGYTSIQNSQFTPDLWSDGGCVAWQDAALGQDVFNIPPAMEVGDSIVPMPMDSFLHQKTFSLAIEPFLQAPFEADLDQNDTAEVPPPLRRNITSLQSAFLGS
jgi:hypothetical protein